MSWLVPEHFPSEESKVHQLYRRGFTTFSSSLSYLYGGPSSHMQETAVWKSSLGVHADITSGCGMKTLSDLHINGWICLQNYNWSLKAYMNFHSLFMCWLIYY